MTEQTRTVLEAPLAELDPEVAEALDLERKRQQNTLEMIASENFVPRAVLQGQGSVLTNKYAEGYPGRRYYGGCEFVDIVEDLAIKRVKELFGAEHANVQPHSGAQANNAVMHALLTPGEKIMGLSLAHGGHLSHGMKLNVSGKLYEVVAYEVGEDGRIDMEQVRQLALAERPKVIIAGWSAYPRQLDFAKFREIADEVGAYLWVDMAHFAGLVAAGLHPNPVPHAHVVSSTVHKTLGGPRSGFILCTEELKKKIDSAVFPGQQGGPLMRDAGVSIATDGTDVHLVLVDLRHHELTGKEAEDLLHDAGITVNRNAVPNDPRPPMVTSGLRIGTSALATRGFDAEGFTEVADIIASVLLPQHDIAALRERVNKLCDKYPLYVGSESW